MSIIKEQYLKLNDKSAALIEQIRQARINALKKQVNDLTDLSTQDVLALYGSDKSFMPYELLGRLIKNLNGSGVSYNKNYNKWYSSSGGEINIEKLNEALNME